MGYTILDENGEPKALRMLGKDYGGTEKFYFKQPFTATSWKCEPCNTPDKRYHVVFQTDLEVDLAWYQIVIDGEDNANDEAVKIAYAEKVEAAYEAMQKATSAYNRLIR